MSIRDGLLVALGLLTVGFTALWGLRLRSDACLAPARPADEVRKPTAAELGIGFLTDFLDTLGIGSFAVTTALFKLLKIAPDEDIPGTLNVGHAIPTFAEAFIFISIVAVEGKTLVL
ncbi:MAG: permease, partial [Elusimicrobia bacterium]|nr:permease [Elusimicrobiota bacterium]